MFLSKAHECSAPNHTRLWKHTGLNINNIIWTMYETQLYCTQFIEQNILQYLGNTYIILYSITPLWNSDLCIDIYYTVRPSVMNAVWNYSYRIEFQTHDINLNIESTQSQDRKILHTKHLTIVGAVTVHRYYKHTIKHPFLSKKV